MNGNYPGEGTAGSETRVWAHAEVRRSLAYGRLPERPRTRQQEEVAGCKGWRGRWGQLMLGLRGHMRNLGLYPEQWQTVEVLSRGEIKLFLRNHLSCKMEKGLEGMRGNLLGEYLYQSTRYRMLNWIQWERWRWRKGSVLRNMEERNSQDLVTDWIHMTFELHFYLHMSNDINRCFYTFPYLVCSLVNFCFNLHFKLLID